MSDSVSDSVRHSVGHSESMSDKVSHRVSHSVNPCMSHSELQTASQGSSKLDKQKLTRANVSMKCICLGIARFIFLESYFQSNSRTEVPE